MIGIENEKKTKNKKDNTMTTYLTDKEGKFIPATQRPDGTWRKARRVKDGYVPQEEVPLYESKGKKISERRAAMYPPGYTPNCIDPLKKERDDLIKAKAMKQSAISTITNASATITTSANGPKVNKKPNITAQKNVTISAQTTKTTASNAKSKKSSKLTNSSSSSSSKTVIIINNNSNDAALDDLSESLSIIDMNDQQSVAKQLKKLRKKMREIETIEEKLESGELKKPEMDQMAKVKRKTEIQDAINRLAVADLRLAASILNATTNKNAAIAVNHLAQCASDISTTQR